MQERETSDGTRASTYNLDILLAGKIKEIIEGQWGKSLTDIKHLSVEQFYERRIVGGQVSYKPINRFVIYGVFGENCVFGMMLREEGDNLLCGWERVNHLSIHMFSFQYIARSWLSSLGLTQQMLSIEHSCP
jgi:hypothetical protein